MVFELNVEGGITYASVVVERVLGYAVNEVEGRTFPFLIHPEDLPRVQVEFEEHLAGHIYPVECRFLRKDGSYCWCRISSRPVYDAAGSVRGLCGVLTDISAHKRAEELLLQSEARFQKLAELMPIGVYLADVNGRCIYVNPRWCEATGLTEDQALGDGWIKALHPDDRDRVLGSWKQAVESEGHRGFEYRFLKPDGTVTWVWGLAVPQRTETGTIGGYIGTITDITKRKQAEESLVESEAKYRALFEESCDAIMMMALPSLQFSACNAAAVEMFRVGDVETFLTKTVEDLSPERQPDGHLSREKAGEMIERASREGHHAFSWVHRRLDGEEFPANVQFARIDIGGESILMGTVRDETERNALEMQARQSQKLDSIGMLAGGAAHEINNPLNGIMNYAQLIVDREDGRDSTVEGYAGEIIRESARIAEMTRSLLQFSRQGTRTHTPAHPRDIVEGALMLMRSAVRHDSILIEADIPADLPSVECHAQQIQQVIMNLVANARDSLTERHGKGGSKTIAVSARLLDQDGGKWVRLTVEDNGVGIPESDLDRLFDPFYTTKSSTRGTGLGLSISHSIVRDHGGTLGVESKVGKYTRFHMDLPAADSAAPGAGCDTQSIGTEIAS